jgi:hypothetical protein
MTLPHISDDRQHRLKYTSLAGFGVSPFVVMQLAQSLSDIYADDYQQSFVFESSGDVFLPLMVQELRNSNSDFD